MENNKYYFFSDVHLGLASKLEEKYKEAKLIAFLDAIRHDAKKIFIVGDLFDCWIEYRKVVPKGFFRTLAKLNEISEQGTEIYFFSGNHDFWVNTYLRDEVGLILCNSFLDIILENKRFYITHGDGLSKKDTGYKIIKKILRNPVNQFLYSLIHPDIGIWLAQSSSKKSRLHTEIKQDDLISNNDNSNINTNSNNKKNSKSFGSSGMKEFAYEKIKQGYNFVIMGHIHKPQLVELHAENNSGYFVTLGDWIKNFSYGEFCNGSFELKKFHFQNSAASN